MGTQKNSKAETAINTLEPGVAQQAEYNIGDIIFHRVHDFRGVIVDVDPQFEGSEEWYDMYTSNQPPKNSPWYHILVDEESSMAYVSEQNICTDSDQGEIENPMIDDLFSKYDSGHYLPIQTLN
jgi:heat shock protein HspQ